MISKATTGAFTRRGVLAATGALAASAVAPHAAFARAPMTGTPAPAFYRFKLGAFEATVVSDGPLPLGDPAASFAGIGKEALAKLLSENFLPTDTTSLEQNALVVNTGERLVLFDTGMGASKMFGASTGRLLANLRQSGIDPKDIDAIVISHAHIDHCNGIMASEGARNFPNAQIYMHQADYDFWTDDGKLGTPMKDLIVSAQQNLKPNRDRMVFFADGQEFLPGIQAVHAPGHTVGHTVFMITSQGKAMSYVADLVHHYVLAMEVPRIEFVFDTDTKQAVSSRLRVLDMLAATKTPLLAYHFPWPGLGQIAKRGDGYRYVALPMQTVL